MFQAKINKTVTPSNWNSSISNRIDISDKIVQTPTFFEYEFLGDIYYFLSFPYFLFKLESQFTKKTKIFDAPSGPFGFKMVQCSVILVLS